MGTASCLIVLAAFSAVDGAAEPVTVTVASFTTQGVFSCLQGLSCVGAGTSSITIGSGDNESTLTFTGVDTTVTVRNVADHVPIGRFDADSSTTDFMFPTGSNPNVPILGFLLTITHSAPVATTNTVAWRFGPGGGMELPVIGNSYFGMSIRSLNLDYPGIVYSFSPHPFSLPNNGVVEIGADVGAVPEPGTLLLVGAGLAGAYARRRRQRAVSVAR